MRSMDLMTGNMGILKGGRGKQGGWVGGEQVGGCLGGRVSAPNRVGGYVDVWHTHYVLECLGGFLSAWVGSGG